MNPRLTELQPYPFQRLRALMEGVDAPADLRAINLSIGEPKNPPPAVVLDALGSGQSGLGLYPATQGTAALREACAAWLARRYGVDVDPATGLLPVNGSREALFAFVQAVIDPQAAGKPVVLSPNPFYQIYEGAALLAGAEPYYVNCTAATRFLPDWASVPEAIWSRTRLVFTCSPGNPSGAVMQLADWQTLFALQDRHGFIIASDECYSEIHAGQPPLGALEAARLSGRGHDDLMMFTSLSKRSNVPGLRSGFVAGDPALIRDFLLYRTYHGSAMSPLIQHASIAAWQDETHVAANRTAYAERFAAVLPLLSDVLDVSMPDAAFYLWAGVPGGDDTAFARALLAEQNVTVLPGSFLARDTPAGNPGRGRIRLALVAPLEECTEAARRIRHFVTHTASKTHS